MPHKGKKKLKTKNTSPLNMTENKIKKRKLKSRKKRQVLVKNIPFQATEEEVRKYLGKLGETCKLKLPRKPNGDLIGHGFIQFPDDKSAAEAIKECSGQNFIGRKIVLDMRARNLEASRDVSKEVKMDIDEITIKEEDSESENERNSQLKNVVVEGSKKNSKLKRMEKKNEFVRNLPINARKFGESYKGELPDKSGGDLVHHDERAFKKFKKKDFMERKVIHGTDNVSKEGNAESAEEIVIKKEDTESEDEGKSRLKTELDERETFSKLNHNKNGRVHKKGRLIVRNLPFKITESDVHKHFEKYGEITEVKLLRKPDGKLVGCGFVQFVNMNCATKAILECSGKPLQGRTIIVDWAVPKAVFNANNKSDAPEEITTKEEPDGDSEEVKPELSDEDDIPTEMKEESLSDDSEEDNDDGSKDDSDDESSDSNDEMSEDELEKKHEIKPKVISNDVSEGRTVFVKNVPFSATNEDLKDCMEQFGTVLYALICIDPITEHPKGTAFVKFQKQESAETCLSAGTELVLHDEILDVFKALNKDDIAKKAAMKEQEKKKGKDNRNLYLVKEGVIHARSKAGEGVSKSDMTRRLQLEQWKNQMLRNLNMYVSPVRLIIHNLPESFTDAKLHELFKKYGGPGAVVKEARVMRDIKNVNAEGVGKSKEFGFVSFTSHENALQALRNINNNPNIFSASKRPIVGFSLENKAIMNIKQKRLEKSKAKNPLYSGGFDKPKNEKINSNKHKTQRYMQTESNNETRDIPSFVGVTSKPGKVQLRKNYLLKRQAAVHSEKIRERRVKERKQRRQEERKKNIKRKLQKSKPVQGKKWKKGKEDVPFGELVKKYKTNLMSSTQKKWHEAT